MRNLVTHEYFRVDLEVVWLVVERDLPKLKLTVEAILRELGEEYIVNSNNNETSQRVALYPPTPPERSRSLS